MQVCSNAPAGGRWCNKEMPTPALKSKASHYAHNVRSHAHAHWCCAGSTARQGARCESVSDKLWRRATQQPPLRFWSWALPHRQRPSPQTRLPWVTAGTEGALALRSSRASLADCPPLYVRSLPTVLPEETFASKPQGIAWVRTLSWSLRAFRRVRAVPAQARHVLWGPGVIPVALFGPRPCAGVRLRHDPVWQLRLLPAGPHAARHGEPVMQAQ